MYLLISTPVNDHFSVAIGTKKVLDNKAVAKEYSQAELLLKTINDLLVANKKKLKDLKGIIIVQGPGAFSALRIGISTANALAYSLNIPIAPIRLKEIGDHLKDSLDLEKAFLNGLKKLKNKTKFDLKKVVKPFYGAEPNIG